MAKALALNVKVRESYGKRRNRRLRQNGMVPAVLYGHNLDAVSLAIPVEEITSVVRHGNRFVSLKGDLNENAFIKDCQWNTWGTEILHIDFARVSEHEKIRVSVPLELRGQAPGTKDGGVVKHILHVIELECEAASVPEKIEVNINHLEFEKSITVKDLPLPAGVVTLNDPALLVVSCAAPIEESEETTPVGEAEPEIIGRKKTEEDSEDEK